MSELAKRSNRRSQWNRLRRNERRGAKGNGSRPEQIEHGQVFPDGKCASRADGCDVR